MLGTPTDIYLTGAMMFWMPIALAIGALIAAYFYLPFFQDLGILSINQVSENMLIIITNSVKLIIFPCMICTNNLFIT